MRVCGIDIKASEAFLAIADVKQGSPIFVPCDTKKIKLGDDKITAYLETFLQTIKNFSNENAIEVFSLKARNHGGLMGGGAVSFKIETLFQLSATPVFFVNAVSLAAFSKGNLGGLPINVLAYQKDAYRSAVFHLHKINIV